MNRIVSLLVFGLVVIVPFRVGAQTVLDSPLAFVGPTLEEHLVAGTSYTFRLNRNPAVPGVYAVRDDQGVLWGTLIGTSTQSTLQWEVGRYATSGDSTQILNPGRYSVWYVGAGNRVLAKSPVWYLEPSPASAGPVVHFAFEGNVKDEKNGHGFAESSGISYHQGAVGDAIAFDGTSGFLSGSVPAAEFTGEPFTISLWIRPEQRQITKVTPLVGVWPHNSKIPAYALVLEKNRVRIDLGRGSITPMWLSGQVLAPHKWHHVVATLRRDPVLGLVGAVYLNGVENPNVYIPRGADDTFTPAPYRGTLVIGGDPIKGIETVAGTIDEVSLYNRTLSPLEVSELYEATRPNKVIQRVTLATFALSIFRPFFTLFGF